MVTSQEKLASSQWAEHLATLREDGEEEKTPAEVKKKKA